jgi:hypothetical protein
VRLEVMIDARDRFSKLLLLAEPELFMMFIRNMMPKAGFSDTAMRALLVRRPAAVGTPLTLGKIIHGFKTDTRTKTNHGTSRRKQCASKLEGTHISSVPSGQSPREINQSIYLVLCPPRGPTFVPSPFLLLQVGLRVDPAQLDGIDRAWKEYISAVTSLKAMAADMQASLQAQVASPAHAASAASESEVSEVQ